MTVITVGIVLTAVIAALWILYTVVWRAVRRGLREYHRVSPVVPAPDLSTRVLRPAPRDIVPDYPPREWV